ncbi:MAG: GtrA family protein [Acidobacteriota bacterium]|nr:GtrA family protein [Acidobacteriota bacterium]
MAWTPKELWDLLSTPAGRRLARYTAVSASATVVSFSTLTVVFGALRLWSEVPSVLFANAVAAVWSYNLNRRWAWGKTGRSHVVREVLPFAVMSLSGMALSTGAAAGAHHLAVSHHLGHLTRTALVLGANLAAWGSLWVVKFLVFNRLFSAPAATALGPAPAGTALTPAPDPVDLTGAPATS